MATKQMRVTLEECKAGDQIVRVADGGQNAPSAFVYTGHSRVGQKNEILCGEGGRDFRAPIGSTYVVNRTLTEEEQQARNAEALAFVVAEARKYADTADERLHAAAREFAEEIAKSNRPTTDLYWKATGLAKVEASAECWGTVRIVARNLAEVDGVDEADAPSDEHIARAVLYVRQETLSALLRGGSGSSTNPYANAIDRDKEDGKREWLRSHTVMAVRSLGKAAGITIEEEVRL